MVVVPTSCDLWKWAISCRFYCFVRNCGYYKSNVNQLAWDRESSKYSRSSGRLDHGPLLIETQALVGSQFLLLGLGMCGRNRANWEGALQKALREIEVKATVNLVSHTLVKVDHAGCANNSGRSGSFLFSHHETAVGSPCKEQLQLCWISPVV